MANELRKNIRDVMTRNPQTVTGKDTLLQAARIMRDQDTGVVPVIDDNKKVTGMITDRDIVLRCVAEGKNPLEARVNEVMTKDVRKVKEDASINEVITMMKGAEIRRVPVVDRNDQIVGIVSMGDIAQEGENKNKVGDVMESMAKAPPNN